MSRPQTSGSGIESGKAMHMFLMTLQSNYFFLTEGNKKLPTVVTLMSRKGSEWILATRLISL